MVATTNRHPSSSQSRCGDGICRQWQLRSHLEPLTKEDDIMRETTCEATMTPEGIVLLKEEDEDSDPPLPLRCHQRVEIHISMQEENLSALYNTINIDILPYQAHMYSTISITSIVEDTPYPTTIPYVRMRVHVPYPSLWYPLWFWFLLGRIYEGFISKPKKVVSRVSVDDGLGRLNLGSCTEVHLGGTVNRSVNQRIFFFYKLILYRKKGSTRCTRPSMPIQIFARR